MNNKQRIKKQKVVSEQILEAVEIIDPNAIIAGGAPRDWYLDMPANDIDVYLYVPDSYPAGAARRALERLFGHMNPLGSTKAEFEDVTKSEDTPYDSMDIRWVFEGDYQGEKVQFIFMKKATYSSVVDEFDSSICKAWFKGGVIRTSIEFTKTMQSKVVYIKDPHGKQNRHLVKLYNRFAPMGFVFTKDKYEPRKAHFTYNVTPWTPSSSHDTCELF